MAFLGLRLGNEPEMSPADIQSLASLAEELGYGEAWMTEGNGRDSLTQLTAIATGTSRIGLGTGRSAANCAKHSRTYHPCRLRMSLYLS
jgi:alkanesulfonate monooxygenase SsuD/methylene tetrahydromethanopterin reductase-like flavin-dependent oxidoreductase (luciferase family)